MYSKFKKLLTNSYHLESLEQLTVHRICKSLLIIVLIIYGLTIISDTRRKFKEYRDKSFAIAYEDRDLAWKISSDCRNKKMSKDFCKRLYGDANSLELSKAFFYSSDLDEVNRVVWKDLWKLNDTSQKIARVTQFTGDFTAHLLKTIFNLVIFIIVCMAFYFWIFLYIFIGKKYKLDDSSTD